MITLDPFVMTESQDALRELMASIMSSAGDPHIILVAKSLGMSVRTLQRRLAGCGLSFKGLVQRRRLAMALRLVAQTNAKVIDIALDVGYSDHAHFTRAFRRWTGVAPLEYRRASRRARTRVTSNDAGDRCQDASAP